MITSNYRWGFWEWYCIVALVVTLMLISFVAEATITADKESINGRICNQQ